MYFFSNIKTILKSLFFHAHSSNLLLSVTKQMKEMLYENSPS